MLKSPASRRWIAGALFIATMTAVAWRARDSAQEIGFRTTTSFFNSTETAPGMATESVPDSKQRNADPDAPPLFAFVRPPEAVMLDRALPAPAHAIHYVRVNKELFTGKPSPFWRKPGEGSVHIPLPGGASATVTIEASEMLGPDRFTSRARITGRPDSRVLFAWNEGFLHVSIEDPVTGNFALRTATATLAQFFQIDPSLVPPCGGERRPPRERSPRRVPADGSPTGPWPAARSFAATENPQRAEVHVMMLYTPSVLNTLAGGERRAAVQSAFDLAIARVNSALAGSLVTARVKLVRVAETNYDESPSSAAQLQDDALTALYQENDGRMDEIHAWRDAAGADIVCLALGRNDAATSGLSFLLDARDDSTNSRFAFSIVQYANIAGTNVVSHELGHVFGCAHDRENALSGPGAFSFSYGYRFVGADGRLYHDIMSYPPGTELGYYSNPAIVVPEPVGVPIGIPAGQPGESNSALTIERTAFLTAGYRLQTQAVAGAGALINVATNAFVGTGNDVLIAGFVVRGPSPKRMLLRAAGPSLRIFGVQDVLADPVLRVFANGVMAAENDNWAQPLGPGTPASPAEISSAATQAHAFAFAAGSADAAAFVTLLPGAYSVVVEGRNGTTGRGLVEAYELERDAARVVNLAMRAHVGRDGRELVGGFVVDRTTGGTKRILIRVLGPTLTRAPWNMGGTLDDPEMELRNAAGELLIKSDDWSMGAEGGASEENDFRPQVRFYGEKQIFATGLAPSNRREPCVLVDLPAGTYYVTVRPYESRSSDPLRDQPAVPGVAVVEVYAIDQ